MLTKYHITIDTLGKMRRQLKKWSNSHLFYFDVSIGANANADPSQCGAYIKQKAKAEGYINSLDYLEVEVNMLQRADELFRQYSVVKAELGERSAEYTLGEFKRDLGCLENLLNFSKQKFYSR